jgi:hypothetical protein
MKMKFIAGLSILLLGAATVSAAETFTATATVKAGGGTKTAPVTISIDRFLTDAERETIGAPVRANDQAKTRKTLEAAPALGYIEVGSRRTPIKYAYARSTGAGRLVTVVTAAPVVYLGADVPDAKPKGQYDIALALLVLDGKDTGDGEFSPAVTLRVDDKGAIVTTDYSHEVVRLTGVKKVK